MTEIFETQRAYNNKYPSKLYTCTKCGYLTSNKYICPNCKNQSNNLFYQGFSYTIRDKGITEKIFMPIENFRENQQTTKG